MNISENKIKKLKTEYDKKGFVLVKNFLPKSKCKSALNWLNRQNKKKLSKSWTEQEPGVDLAVYFVIHSGNSLIAKLANNKTWSKEHLSAKISVKLVNNINDAVNHINKYGTMHTDAIITNNKISAKFFIKNVKSSIAIHNSSTQYADGGEFGFGGEVGISTNKLPPRGPVGLNQLVSYKYEIYGSGQTRK